MTLKRTDSISYLVHDLLINWLTKSEDHTDNVVQQELHSKRNPSTTRKSLFFIMILFFL